MIRLTPEEFHKLREGIAAAHLYIQAFSDLVGRSQREFNKSQRSIRALTPSAVGEAFTTVAQITHRENRDPNAEPSLTTRNLGDIDTRLLRDELENVSALIMPDLNYEMVTALGELPMYHETITSEPMTTSRLAMLMAWACEAGRRYGIQQVMALVEATSHEFRDSTVAALACALNSALELPATETTVQSAKVQQFSAEPGATVKNVDGGLTPYTFEETDDAGCDGEQK